MSVSTLSFLYYDSFHRDLFYKLDFSDPRPDLGLRPQFFEVFSAPATSSDQRRNRYGWRNNWKLSWRQMKRRGRFNSAINRFLEDTLMHCPINITFYFGAPAVWAQMPTGK